MDRPKSLRDLVGYLTDHKFCELTDTRGRVEIVRFNRAADGGLWFDGPKRSHYVPVRCGVGEADLSETGVAFDPEGFSLTKFGVSIRVRYLTPASMEPSEN